MRVEEEPVGVALDPPGLPGRAGGARSTTTGKVRWLCWTIFRAWSALPWRSTQAIATRPFTCWYTRSSCGKTLQAGSPTGQASENRRQQSRLAAQGGNLERAAAQRGSGPVRGCFARRQRCLVVGIALQLRGAAGPGRRDEAECSRREGGAELDAANPKLVPRRLLPEHEAGRAIDPDVVARTAAVESVSTGDAVASDDGTGGSRVGRIRFREERPDRVRG